MSLRDGDKRVPRARRLRRDQTTAERKLWGRLRELPISTSHFRRQATVGPYYIDFACHQRRLAIELDGGQHALPQRAAFDAKRTAYLRSQGYQVLRFWNDEIFQNIDGVLTVILAALEQPSPPTPDPSPPRATRAGGGEACGSRVFPEPAIGTAERAP
jgi:very-short-patch-repair endonuclease